MECIHNRILDKVVFGYAHHKLLLDSDGKPTDYLFVEINKTYKNLFDFHSDEIAGRRASELFPGYDAFREKWIGLFGRIALNRGEEEFDYFSEPLNKWFRVQVFSTEKMYFSMTFFDVTSEKYLLESLQDLHERDAEEPDYQKMCEDMRAISGAKYVVFNMMDIIGKSFQTKAIAGLSKDLENASGFLGYKVVGKKWANDQQRLETLYKNTITKYPSLFALASSALSNEALSKVVSWFKTGEVYLVSIKKRDKVYGDFTLLMKRGEQLRNKELIRMYAWQVSVLLNDYFNRKTLNHIFEVSPDLIAITDLKGHLLRVNSSWKKYLDKSTASLLGRSFYELIHPEDIEATKQAVEKIKKEKSLNGFINRYLTKDNKYRHFEWQASYRDGFIYGAARDITETMEANLRLKQKSEFQGLLVDVAINNINLPLAEKDQAIQASLEKMGAFAEADRAYIFDYLWKEGITRNTYEWCAEGIAPQIENLRSVPLSLLPEWVKSHQKGQSMVIPDVSALDKDSGLRQVLEPQEIKSLLAIPMIEGSNLTGFVGFDWVRTSRFPNEDQQILLNLFAQMLVNIRKRTALEEKLLSEKENAQKADRLKMAFLNNISHEVRTPLNGILGFADLLAEQQSSAEEAQEYLRLMQTNSQRLIKTITDYVDISMITSGNMTKSEAAFSPYRLIDDLKNDFQNQLKGKPIKLNWDCPAEKRSLYGDKDLIYKVYYQLIENACKFTKRGAIRVGCHMTGDNLIGFVEDTGMGIPGSIQSKIFDAFVQEENSDTRKYQGNGLGLSIVKGIVDFLEGNIKLQSSVDNGTKVEFTIPIRRDEKQAGQEGE